MFKKIVNSMIKEAIDEQKPTVNDLERCIDELMRCDEIMKDKVDKITKIINANDKYQKGLQQQWANFIQEQLINNSKLLNRIEAEILERKKMDAEIQIQIDAQINVPWFKRLFKRKKLKKESLDKISEVREYYNKKLIDLDTEYLKYNKSIERLNNNK